MNELINALLKSDRLEYLMCTPEYYSLKLKCLLALDKLKNGGLTEEETEYFDRAYVHLQNIMPHYKKCIVDGEEVEVLFMVKEEAIPDV